MNNKKILVCMLTLIFTALNLTAVIASPTSPNINYHDVRPLSAVVATWNIGKETTTDVVATLDSEGVLTISGTGDINPNLCLWSGVNNEAKSDTTHMEDVKSVVFTGTIKPTSMWSMFSGNHNLTTIDWGTLDTSECTSMTDAFNGTKISSFDFTKDFSKVTDWSYTFANTSNLTTVNMENVLTDKVTTTSGMFKDSNLASINLTGSDTSNVTDMSHMFEGTKLTTINLAPLNTSKVTDMKYFMFNVPTMTTFQTGLNFKVPEICYYDYTDNGRLFYVNAVTPLNITGDIAESLRTYVLLEQKHDNRAVTYNGTPANSLWHLITFDPNGGLLTSRETYSIAHKGKAIRPSDPVKAGATFVQWNNGTIPYDFDLPVTTDLTLTAEWIAGGYPDDPDDPDDPEEPGGEYTVTFVAGASGGEGSTFSDGKYSKAIRTSEDGDINFAPNPIDQYQMAFSYWSKVKVDSWMDTSDDGSNRLKSTDIVTHNMTVYAVYTEVSNEGSFWKVTYDYNGGKLKGKSTKTEYVLKGKKATKPSSDPKKSGASFKGWYTGTNIKEDDKYDFSDKVTEDITIYAGWSDSSSSSSMWSSSSSSYRSDYDYTTDDYYSDLMSLMLLDSLFGSGTSSQSSPYTYRDGKWYDANGNVVSMNSVSGMPNTGLGFQGVPLLIIILMVIICLITVILHVHKMKKN